MVTDTSTQSPRLFLKVLDPHRFASMETFGDLPIFLAHGGRARAFGKGLTKRQRKLSAIGEWLERQILYTATPEKYAAEEDLGGDCLSPPLFGIDLASEMPHLVMPYHPSRRVGWISVRSLEGEQRWLHQPGWEEVGFYRPTSNGAAVHRTRRAALQAAAAELLERHAFVAWWYRLAPSRLMSPDSQDWRRLDGWFASRGWDLSAHLLGASTSFPVVLAFAARRTPAGSLQAGMIGLGTAIDSVDIGCDAAVSAALEIVQAMEIFAIREAGGYAIGGDLAEFLTPAGATEIEDRLDLKGSALSCEPQQYAGCPLTAAQISGIQLWIANRSSTLIGVPGFHCLQVFSPDTLPFPSTGRGRRIDHPVLHTWLARQGRGVTSLPLLPHPLG
ncbi:YcaO-like family protein [Streptomyces sp. Lzd4kr]|nr:YcaO-like family protein [Streptomyces sp. Lzd4kr]